MWHTQHKVCVSQSGTNTHTHICSLLIGGLWLLCILRSGSGQVKGAKVMGLAWADQLCVWIRGCELDESLVKTPVDGGAVTSVHRKPCYCVSATSEYCCYSTTQFIKYSLEIYIHVHTAPYTLLNVYCILPLCGCTCLCLNGLFALPVFLHIVRCLFSARRISFCLIHCTPYIQYDKHLDFDLLYLC